MPLHLAPTGCWDKVGQGGIIFLDVTVPTFSTYPEAINETNQIQMIQWPQIPVAILHKSTLTLDTTQPPSCFPQCYFFSRPCLFIGRKAPECSQRHSLYPLLYVSGPSATWGTKKRRGPGRVRDGEMSPGEPSRSIPSVMWGLQEHLLGTWN